MKTQQNYMTRVMTSCCFIAVAISSINLTNASFQKYSMMTIGSYYSPDDVGSVRIYSLTNSGDALQASGQILLHTGNVVTLASNFFARDMNDRLEVVGLWDGGYSQTPSAAKWSPSGGYGTINTASDGLYAQAYGVNNDGTVLVSREAQYSLDGEQGLIHPDGSYTKISPISVLNGFRGGGYLNEQNQAIVATRLDEYGSWLTYRTGLLTGSSVEDFAVNVGDDYRMRPNYLNNNGVAVGLSAHFVLQPGLDATDQLRAIYWKTPLSALTVDPLTGFQASQFDCVNDGGTAFGILGKSNYFDTGDTPYTHLSSRAFAYSPSMGTSLVDSLVSNLPSGFHVLDITATNSRGDLAGYATNGSSLIAVKLTASSVPSPSAILVMGIALINTRRKSLLKTKQGL